MVSSANSIECLILCDKYIITMMDYLHIMSCFVDPYGFCDATRYKNKNREKCDWSDDRYSNWIEIGFSKIGCENVCGYI